ncbi:MAG: hypothetical protein COB39_07470 [Marinosulfonomonas sp.]|nr:MAG: hypothetical protein COB39_07470 [Marinosulfonomonas sp.]
MKILIPILGFSWGGGYRVLSKLADAWLDLGHDITFLIPETSPPPYFPTRAAIIRANRRGVIDDDGVFAKTERKRTGADNILSLYAGLTDVGSRFDFILANHSLTTWPVKFAKCGTAKKIYYIQAYEPDYYSLRTDPIKHLLARLSYHFGLLHISNSRTYPKGSATGQVSFVPPGVDTDNFHPRENRTPLADSEVIYLGTIGRTEPYKGTQFVLDAFEKLHMTDPRFRLRVAFGNLPSGWSHPAAEVVTIENDNELADFYRSQDILLVGCIGQFGAPHYPVIEGMACGTPVVHTGYFPGNPDNSWLVAPENAQALVEGVNEVMACKTPATKTQNGLQFVSENLAWGKVATQMLDIFDATL